MNHGRRIDARVQLRLDLIDLTLQSHAQVLRWWRRHAQQRLKAIVRELQLTGSVGNQGTVEQRLRRIGIEAERAIKERSSLIRMGHAVAQQQHLADIGKYV